MEQWYRPLLLEPPACRLTHLPCFASLTCQVLLQQVNLIPATVGLLGQVGVNCVPITVIGTGVGCQAIQQSAYCPGDYFVSLVIVDCPPININA
ncbi:hypothetical protein EDD16DRAFT_1633369 [Pisolithus croceorrhizus]|nr:hypothetical protein EDD16DRAFT_1633369 [Pisolithus croceorrhizus]